ncbi:unnamed protein product [Coffea canephora]|uniref:DH200=94 genomic scaffold, scaffold_67 n=1 Tax=Coffea canephora TaxID=49390 RepID=A0A068UVT0_COFCA|nr:unnamed protein product [Coffea canephora]
MEIDAGSLLFVKSKYPLYVDTASCNITANHYSYVVVGESVVASDIEESCTVYKILPVDLRRLPDVTAGDIPFQDIHNLLSNGYEISWYILGSLTRRRSRSFFCDVALKSVEISGFVCRHVFGQHACELLLKSPDSSADTFS